MDNKIAGKKLYNFIKKIDLLMQIPNINSKSEEFINARAKIKNFIIKYYGEESIQYRDFSHISFDSMMIYANDAEKTRKCKEGLTKCRANLQAYLEDIEDEIEESETKSVVENNVRLSGIPLNNKIFIVHGHDGELKEAVARVVEKQNIKPIILSEKANQGKTIIGKLEHYSDVGAAILLFTNDDIGKENDEKDYNPRARQNVVLEAGYFIGKLGREHVIMFADPGNEIPGDLSGMVYTNTQDWKGALGKELEAMGFNIDFKKLFD